MDGVELAGAGGNILLRTQNHLVFIAQFSLFFVAPDWYESLVLCLGLFAMFVSLLIVYVCDINSESLYEPHIGTI